MPCSSASRGDAKVMRVIGYIYFVTVTLTGSNTPRPARLRFYKWLCIAIPQSLRLKAAGMRQDNQVPYRLQDKRNWSAERSFAHNIFKLCYVLLLGFVCIEHYVIDIFKHLTVDTE